MSSSVSGSDGSTPPSPPTPELPNNEQFRNYERYLALISEINGEYLEFINSHVEILEELDPDIESFEEDNQPRTNQRNPKKESLSSRVNALESRIVEEKKRGKLTYSQSRGLVGLLHRILYPKYRYAEESPGPSNQASRRSSIDSFDAYHQFLTINEIVDQHFTNIPSLSEDEKNIAKEATLRTLSEERNGIPKSLQELRTTATFFFASKNTLELCANKNITPDRAACIENEVVRFMKDLLHIHVIPNRTASSNRITDV